jgi:hypothetical protein
LFLRAEAWLRGVTGRLEWQRSAMKDVKDLSCGERVEGPSAEVAPVPNTLETSVSSSTNTGTRLSVFISHKSTVKYLIVLIIAFLLLSYCVSIRRLFLIITLYWLKMLNNLCPG